eukprot:TRINITY_DN76011_c0_g1_i1.p1 TRINITY_DN76011_c0_g1~~TRINITY_DN76011_c0_g1_i1.p1  ORF type:complete len:542 (+),score=98.76 TRINITY_DN76011_c0_g1_i1:71-1696(+)
MSCDGYGGSFAAVNIHAKCSEEKTQLSGEDVSASFARARSGSGDSTQSACTFKHVFTPQHPGCFNDYYDLEDMIGHGSFGSTYRGRAKHPADSGSDMTLPVRAIKTVSTDVTQRRFEQEIKVQKRLDHPNITRLFEVFKDKAKYYLVLELCTGGELFDRIVQAGGFFDENTAASYLKQLLSAVNYLHNHTVAHRDIKPENLLFQSKESGAPLKLIDFGCARSFTRGQGMSSSLGTPMYVAPEVLKKDYNEKCDVWSCGVVTYMMLCGEAPFSGPDEQAVLNKIVSGDFDFDEADWDDISEEAKHCISSMLTVQPQIRPAAASLLDHDWFKGHTESKKGKPPKDLVSRLTSFKLNSQFKKIVLSVAAQLLRDDEIKEMQSTFLSLDVNGDGTLSHAEVIESLKSRGTNLPPDFTETLDSIDTDGSGAIDYTEFLASTLARKQYLREEVLWNVFRTFDLDGDGKIQQEEFAQVVTMSDCDVIKSMFQEVDLNGDHQIDFHELCTMMRDNGPMSPSEQVRGSLCISFNLPDSSACESTGRIRPS